MWVVKLGGSLNGDESLREWLDLLARLGGGRVTVVCGGGGFADEVRRAQAQWRFDDLSAHNMAVLAMAQSSYLAQGLVPALRLARTQDDIRQVLHGGHTALWLPYAQLRERPDATTHWETSADSIALDLARRLNAERMVVVKSCPIDPAAGLAELGASGVLDKRFAGIAKGASFPIDIVHKSELARVKALLLGAVRSFEQ
jgi:5-(aminomethyl)-3-furanmethanol phosphate kinase